MMCWVIKYGMGITKKRAITNQHRFVHIPKMHALLAYELYTNKNNVAECLYKSVLLRTMAKCVRSFSKVVEHHSTFVRP